MNSWFLEASGVEPLTFSVQRRRSTNWAKPPGFCKLLLVSCDFWRSIWCGTNRVTSSSLEHLSALRCLCISYYQERDCWNSFVAESVTYWAILDSNQGPHPYQGCALATWANSPQPKKNTTGSLSCPNLRTVVSRIFTIRDETRSVSTSCNFTMLYISRSLITVPRAKRFLSGTLNFSSINDNCVTKTTTGNFNCNIYLASPRSITILLHPH